MNALEFFRKRIATPLGVMLVCALEVGSVQAMSLGDVFDSVNADSNISGPAVVQGQTMNMLSGGSLFMRAPRRTYSIVRATPPRFSAGCGGIDLFTGGFSFINQEQFVAMLRNIGSNALGYAFKLAIKNICPQCDSILQALEASANLANRLNIDSCEAAKGIVNMTIGDVKGTQATNAAKIFGVDAGLFDDATQAWTKVADSFTNTSKALGDAAERKPDLKEHLPFGNTTWKALKTMGGLDDDYREVLMTIVGTTVYTKDADGGQPYPAMPITFKDLIGSPGQNDTKFNVYKCSDTTDCMSPVLIERVVPSFRGFVRGRLNEVVDAIAQRRPYTDVASTMRFLGMIDFPVYKMISVLTSLDNTALASAYLDRMEELIAVRYAQLYLKQAIRDVRVGMAAHQATTRDAAASDLLKKNLDDASRIDAQGDAEYAVVLQRTQAAGSVMQEVAHLERQVMANLSPMLTQSAAFGRGRP